MGILAKKRWEKPQSRGLPRLVGRWFEYLEKLYELGEVHIGELARILDRDNGETSRAISSLELVGLVETSRRGNRKYCRLTQKGRAIVDFYLSVASSKDQQGKIEDASHEEIDPILAHIGSSNDLVREKSERELAQLSRTKKIGQYPLVWSTLAVLKNTAQIYRWDRILEIFDGMVDISMSANDKISKGRLRKLSTTLWGVAEEPVVELTTRRKAVRIMEKILPPSALRRQVSTVLRRAIRSPMEEDWKSFLVTFRHTLRELNRTQRNEMLSLQYGLLEGPDELIRARTEKLLDVLR